MPSGSGTTTSSVVLVAADSSGSGGQGFSSQSAYWRLPPSQLLPPICGYTFTKRSRRFLPPLPHDWVHASQAPQAPQTQSMPSPQVWLLQVFTSKSSPVQSAPPPCGYTFTVRSRLVDPPPHDL